MTCKARSILKDSKLLSGITGDTFPEKVEQDVRYNSGKRRPFHYDQAPTTIN
ncbi:hypothetical protein [Pelagicoccus mobilis]|uniref:Uncharacterized protein n=1 Tax=Pelagicoccus mobilis TaxID=415221 RepID=A0A934RZP5_9BACT|nr:hypothetical protein [Pelagicoccus mobilis]MBK1880615.1 hypothetical protein [Pelagicoccus mobilis]